MKILTDTHTLVWALSSPEALGTAARAALAESPFTASVANFWELTLSGFRILFPWWEKYAVRMGIPALAIRSDHI